MDFFQSAIGIGDGLKALLNLVLAMKYLDMASQHLSGEVTRQSKLVSSFRGLRSGLFGGSDFHDIVFAEIQLPSVGRRSCCRMKFAPGPGSLGLLELIQMDSLADLKSYISVSPDRRCRQPQASSSPGVLGAHFCHCLGICSAYPMVILTFERLVHSEHLLV